MGVKKGVSARRNFIGGAGMTAALAAVGLSPERAQAQAKQPLRLRIGYQFGLVYAPVLLMKELGLVKRYAPDATVEYSRVASGAVVRDQMIAKQLDIGVLGPPPFQIGWQHLNLKYLCGAGISPYKLVTWKENIRSLKDFKPEDKIATPGPGSVQHILLSMAPKKELGDARALDKNLVSLPHPDATAAILAKNPTVVAHFANVPFLFMELDAPYVHVVLDGFDAFGGPFTSPMAFAAPEFIDANPLGVAVFLAAYNDAMAMLNLESAKAANALAKDFKQTPEVMLRWLTWPGITYTSLPYGIMGWHEFMLEAGYVKKVQKSLAEVCSNQALAWIGIEHGKGKNPAQRLQDRRA